MTEQLPAPVAHTVNAVSAGVMSIIAPITGATAAVGCTTAVIITLAMILLFVTMCCLTSPCWILYIVVQGGG